MKSFIKAISTYLPQKRLSNLEISEQFPEWESDKILSKIGIQNRNITSKDEYVSDIAANAINNLFQEYEIDKNTIDFLIICTQSPDYLLPTTACIVQDKVGLKTSCGAIDINQGCSGYIYGLSLANALIVSGTSQNVLLVTAETYTKHIHPSDKGNRSLFGDASTATLVSTEGEFEIGKFSLGTDGSGAENLIIKNGASKHLKTHDSDDMNNYLYMNGPEIFDFTSKSVPALVSDNLLKNSISKEDIDTFIFHQANTFMLNFLRKKIDIPTEKFIVDMMDYGNTVSSTIPIALKNTLINKRVMKNIMLVGFGVGYSWGAVILNKNKND